MIEIHLNSIEFHLKWPSAQLGTIILSISFCLVTSIPTKAGPMRSFTFCTAFSTPLPSNLFLSPSRSSKASNV